MRASTLLLAFVLMAFPALAQEKTVPASRGDIAYSFAPVVKKAAPAVVNIYTKQRVTVVENVSPFMNDPFFQQFFGQQGLTFGGRPREQVISSLGSGVIVNPKGFIVTAHHVIKDAQKITVVLSNKKEYDAAVVVKDPQSDLAFLKIDAGEALPYLEMRDSDTLEVGDLVLAIGNPFGVGQTVTSGIVSALARKAEGVADYQFFIQTDAAINPGNSGGALITADGRLVGINTAIYSRSGGSHGIGFAIPSNMLRSLMESRVEGGRIVRPWLGVQTQPVTPEIAEALGSQVRSGALVHAVHPDSPAAKAALKPGDVIVAVGGAAVASPEDLAYRLALAKIGDEITLGTVRKGSDQTLRVRLVAPPENPKRDLRTLKGRHPFNGVTVANLSPALAIELGMDDTASGVVVAAAGDGAGSFTIGWGRGDILLEINGMKMTSSRQLEEALSKPARNWTVVYRRGGAVNTLTVQM